MYNLITKRKGKPLVLIGRFRHKEEGYTGCAPLFGNKFEP
jgi:hypothetical protein